jgi:phosphoribosylformylglycinamidine cyclo-ligase
MTTYKDAGVDMNAADEVKKGILAVLKTTIPGHFAGVVEFGDYYLAMCTDGVGTKVLVADHLKKWDTVGIDMVAMNVNDCICIGAKPIALVDYIAIDKVDSAKIGQIIKGVAAGAKEADCEVVGGETAIMPDTVKGFDLAGTALGFVKKGGIITGEGIREGDAIIGLESSGVHSNGITLARKVLDLDKWGKELLKPTRIYVNEIMSIVGPDVHGLSNITGGGLKKITRILPKGLGAEITDPLEPQAVFKEIQKQGGVSDYEMYRTFNMGMGFAIICAPEAAKGIMKKLKTRSKIVGKIVKGEGVRLAGKNLTY